ncbi:MAG: EpsD family peptidyl-prolyl cis-trans isomerase [Pseudomonadota bacterium]
MPKQNAFLALTITLIALSGCGGEDKKAATQVAAKVDKGEISVHQVNAVLARTPNLPQEQAKAAGRQILDKLIDQEVLVQQAVASKLDRDPKTMQAIENARRDILARSFIEKVSTTVHKPSAEDIKEYYGKHPELFAERRIYNFNEIAIKVTPELLPQLEEQMKKAKSLADVTNWLKAQNVPMAANSTTKAAEQLPLELLPRFHQMKEGQIGVIPTKEAVLIVQLAASKTVPVDEKGATPFIEQFLLNKLRAETVDKEVKALRGKAKVEYMGEFAQAPATPAEAPKPVEAAQPQKPAPDSAIDKGLSGLK